MEHKPCAPEAPMLVDGAVLPGDTAFMLRCMIEELLCGGVAPAAIEAMARDENYQSLFAARASLGDEAFRAVLRGAAACVGTHACRVHETPAADFEAPLTIHGAAAPEGGAP